jgi:hypothetical protein
MADTTPKSYSADPTLYLYTSLTAGSSHIITATSRLETILKANKIPFRALDVATDEKARMLWGRRSKGKKLPGLVKFGSIVGVGLMIQYVIYCVANRARQDLEEIEEWNEYGELKQHIGATPTVSVPPATSTANTPSKPPPSLDTSTEPPSATPAKSEHIHIEEPAEGHRKTSASAPKKGDTPLTMAMRQAGAEAAQKASQRKVVKPGSLLSDNPTSPDTPTPSTATDTKLSKAFEEPDALTEITAAKTPAVLAAEGAKRTSVDKIAESESSTDAESESPKSTEESVLQARRTSSITKTKTPLSTETALESTPSLSEQQHFEERPRTHRGSSVSDASKEEIECVEKSQAIPEEDEGEESEPCVPQPEETKVQTSKEESKPALADVTPSDKQEQSSELDNELRAQNAKEGAAAGVRVGD